MFGNRRSKQYQSNYHSKSKDKQFRMELKCATEPYMEFLAEYNFFVLLLFLCTFCSKL